MICSMVHSISKYFTKVVKTEMGPRDLKLRDPFLHDVLASARLLFHMCTDFRGNYFV
jgi:hypothetical protein